VVKELLSTVVMFEPLLQASVPDWVAKINIDFLNNYANRYYPARNVTEVTLDASEIHSGDFLGIVRFDGLDPMLGWAMGSTTGHTAVTIWRDGVLNICESTTKDSYWPINGIQCNEYSSWLAMAKNASHNVVFAPLTPENRAKFNETAANEFIDSVLGLDYGYNNMLLSWIDTVTDNYPCLPPDFNQCFEWYHIEVLFGLVGKLIPSAVDMIINQALNIRLGTTNLTFPDVLYESDKQGIPASSLPTIVEQDSFLYPMKKNGNTTVMAQSMVCCVFVCNVWKASGLFDIINNEINCAEQTNWDVYSMTFFDSSFHPQQCLSADPNNTNCQLLGEWSLSLNNYNSKTPFPHVGEKCASLPPDYNKDPKC